MRIGHSGSTVIIKGGIADSEVGTGIADIAVRVITECCRSIIVDGTAIYQQSVERRYC
jgi:hypothetical protein